MVHRDLMLFFPIKWNTLSRLKCKSARLDIKLTEISNEESIAMGEDKSFHKRNLFSFLSNRLDLSGKSDIPPLTFIFFTCFRFPEIE